VGFVPDGRKPGRPPSEQLRSLRKLFPEFSERTIARYARALRLLAFADVSGDVERRLFERCKRANGNSLNVAAFERGAEDLAAVRIAAGSRLDEANG
jgi:hypothetical protein